jgi:hypothetical protein
VPGVAHRPVLQPRPLHPRCTGCLPKAFALCRLPSGEFTIGSHSASWRTEVPLPTKFSRSPVRETGEGQRLGPGLGNVGAGQALSGGCVSGGSRTLRRSPPSGGTREFSLNRRGFQRPIATADKAHISDFPASYFRKSKK